MSVSLALVYAGGDKNQHEIGAPEAPGRAMMREAIKLIDYFRVFLQAMLSNLTWKAYSNVSCYWDFIDSALHSAYLPISLDVGEVRAD